MTENMIRHENETSSEVLSAAYSVGMEAAINASKLVLQYWPSATNQRFNPALNLDVEGKDQGTGNYVTAADKASEKLIIEAIQSNPLLSEHRIIAEESDPVSSESEWQWVIDPIDGTPPFKNGMAEFGISIGLLKGQEPVMGIIAMPALGQILVSRKDNGVQLLSTEGEVMSDVIKSPALPLDQILVGYDLGYAGREDQLTNVVAKLSDNIGYPVSYGSSSTANFRLALGNIGAYFCKSPTKFDIGAASAIIAELGGVVTDMSGNPIDWQAPSTSYLASLDPRTHQQILEIIHST